MNIDFENLLRPVMLTRPPLLLMNIIRIKGKKESGFGLDRRRNFYITKHRGMVRKKAMNTVHNQESD
jgi:hypothetical protein